MANTDAGAIIVEVKIITLLTTNTQLWITLKSDHVENVVTHYYP